MKRTAPIFLLLLSLVAAACDSADEAAATTTTTTATQAPTTTTSTSTTTTLPEVGMAVPVVRSPVSDEVVYFVMTDRFANGDRANDLGDADSVDPLVSGYLPEDPRYYHGGDLAGLMDRLDYLEDLGVTALWLTPAFTNRTVQGNGTVDGSSAGYHGYWQVDFTRIDPHLGTNEEMRALVDAAHARGMKVFFDIVANHTGDVITYAEDRFAYQAKSSEPYRDASGGVFDDVAVAGEDDFPVLDAAVSFPYTPTFASEGDAAVKRPDWLNDPVYYHNRGDSTFTGENSTYGDFFGLDDLFTEHPDVVAGMIDIYRNAIDEFDVDGFRVDTVKHVNDEFWEDFVPAIRDHARAAGKDDFFVFGEVFSEDPIFTSTYTTRLGFSGTLDFAFSSAAILFAGNGAATSVLEDRWRDGDWFIDADSNASMQVKFIGNHDIGRLGTAIVNANPGADDDELLARTRLALELLFFTQGVPVVYYGDEQGFTGAGGDTESRQDMFPSAAEDYADDDQIGSDATPADDNFDPAHPLYATIAGLTALRSEHPALRSGSQQARWSETDTGVYAFSRIERSERVEYLVVLNNAEQDRTVSLSVASPSTRFNALYPRTRSDSVASDASGGVTVTVPALGAVVYRAVDPIPTFATAPEVRIVSPQQGAEVGFRRFRIEAETDALAYVEVTFAVSVNGGDFTLLGTDDAAPYRVFWDSGGVADGAVVKVMATLDDLTGGRSVATRTFTLGERG